MSDEKFDLDKYLEQNLPKEGQEPKQPVGAGAGRGFVNPPTAAQLFEKEKAEQAAHDEEMKKLTAAGAGAATGAFLRHKGVEAKNVFGPGQNVYQPSEKNINSINMVLRQKTGDPTMDVRGLTTAQVERILSGGPGSALDTSGRQRSEGFGLESQRRSRVQQETENLVNRLSPTTRDPLAAVGEPLVPLKSDLIVPRSVAVQQHEQQTANQLNAIQNAEQKLRTYGLKSGAAKVGMGTVGGALTGLQGYNMATQKEPVDWSQYLSLLGNLGITFGGPKLGTVGGLAQIPYAVKHREDIARGMGLGEINPTAFGGAPEALETPIGSAMGNR
jgi:hypothetical protein